jgi:hypothetical protein
VYANGIARAEGRQVLSHLSLLVLLNHKIIHGCISWQTHSGWAGIFLMIRDCSRDGGLCRGECVDGVKFRSDRWFTMNG